MWVQTWVLTMGSPNSHVLTIWFFGWMWFIVREKLSLWTLHMRGAKRCWGGGVKRCSNLRCGLLNYVWLICSGMGIGLCSTHYNLANIALVPNEWLLPTSPSLVFSEVVASRCLVGHIELLGSAHKDDWITHWVAMRCSDQLIKLGFSNQITRLLGSTHCVDMIIYMCWTCHSITWAHFDWAKCSPAPKSFPYCIVVFCANQCATLWWLPFATSMITYAFDYCRLCYAFGLFIHSPPHMILGPLQPPFLFGHQHFSIRSVSYSYIALLLRLKDLCHESNTFGYRIRQSLFSSFIDVLCDSLPTCFVAFRVNSAYGLRNTFPLLSTLAPYANLCC